jgi:hypothetical protein
VVKTNTRDFNSIASYLPRKQMSRTIALFLFLSLSMPLSVEAALSPCISPKTQEYTRSSTRCLRRCTSLTCDLSLASSLDDLSVQSQSTCPAYTPAHSRRMTSLRSEVSSPLPTLRSEDDTLPRESEQRVYTQLQTQLYPDMQF